MRWVFLLWNSFVYFTLFGALPAFFCSAFLNLSFSIILTGIFIIFLLPQIIPLFSGLIIAFFGAKIMSDKELGSKRSIIDEIRWQNPKIDLMILKYQSNFPNIIGVAGFHNKIQICFHSDILNQLTEDEFKAAINVFLLRKRFSRNIFENFNVLSLCLVGLIFRSFKRRNPFSLTGAYMDVFARLLVKPMVDLARSLTTDKNGIIYAENEMMIDRYVSSHYISLISKVKMCFNSTLLGLADLQGSPQISLVNPVVELDFFELESPKDNNKRLYDKFWKGTI